MVHINLPTPPPPKKKKKKPELMYIVQGYLPLEEKTVGTRRRHSEGSEIPIWVVSVFFLRIFIKLYMKNLYTFQ